MDRGNTDPSAGAGLGIGATTIPVLSRQYVIEGNLLSCLRVGGHINVVHVRRGWATSQVRASARNCIRTRTNDLAAVTHNVIDDVLILVDEEAKL